ncbi:phage tail length tape measure family protein [Azospirillum sp. A26]|uniref:phage tail length tape measure family protein n=1 Tax=Azospirillum sp. A26 TaxID=3160607 RepID=UPI0036708443
MTEEKIASLTVDGSGALNTLDQIEARMDKVGDSVESNSRRLASYGRDFSAIARSLGVYTDAWERVKRVQEGAQRAVDAGRITQEQANRVIGEAKLRYDETARSAKAAADAQAQAAAEMARATAATAQGLEQVRRQYDPAYAAAAKYRDEVARVSKVMDAAGVTGHEYAATLKAIADALDPVTRAERQRAEESARAAETEAQAQAALADELDRVRSRYNGSSAEVRRYIEEMNRVTRILEQANVAEQERVRILGEVAAAYDPLVRAEKERADAERRAQEQAEQATQQMIERERATQRAADAQEHFNRLLGVNTASRTSAAGSASVFEGADQEAQALQRLLDKLDPAAAAQRRFADQQKQLDEALAAKKIDDAQYTRLTKSLQDQQAAFTGAARSATAHTRALQILSPQLSDIAVQAYSGTSALTILVQQGPQIFDGLMAAGKEAVVAAARFALLAAPVLAIGAALGAVAYGAARFNSDVREFDRTVRLTGGAVGVASGQFADFSDQVAATAGVSQASAREMVTAFAGTGRIGAGMLSDLTKATKDWALVTGRDTDEASSDLAKLFSDPSKAVDELTSRYGLFDAAQARVIKNYQAQGELERAQQLLLQGLENRAAGAAEKLGALEQGWKNLKKFVSDGVDEIARAEQGPSRQEQIQRLQWSLNGSGGYLTTAGRRADEDELARLEQLERDDSIQGWANGVRAEFVRVSHSMDEFARSVDPVIAAQEALENRTKQVARAEELGAVSKQEAIRLLELYRRQLLDTLSPTQAFAEETERQARVMEAAAGRMRDFEQQRQATLAKRGAKPGDSLTQGETATINTTLDRKYAAEAADRHRTAQEAIIDARALAAATASLSQPAIIAAQAEAVFFKVLRESNDWKKADRAERDAYTKGMIEWSAQVDASVKTSSLAVDAARRLAAAQAQGGDIAMAMAQAQNVYAENIARGIDPTRARTLAQADLQKSMAALAGQQAAWNRDLAEQIEAARRLADAEGVSAAAVAETTIQNKARAQALKEGVGLESDRARAIEVGTRALEAQNAIARVNNTIRSQNRDLQLARAEYDLLGSSNAERERGVAIMKATLEVQDSADWQQAPKEARDAWVAQAGAVAEYQARVADATATSRDFASAIATGFENALLSGEKFSDVLKSLVKDIERVFLRSFVTKPLETWVQGTMTKLLSPTPVGDSAVQPVKAADPGGNLARFQELARRASTAPVPVLVTNAAGMGGMGATDAQPLPVAVKSAAGLEVMADQIAGKYGLDASLFKAVITRESSWNPNAVNPKSGAAGLGQVMPANWKAYGITNPLDAQQNMEASARILREHLDRAGGDVSKALSTYSGHIKTSGDAYVASVMSTKGAYDRGTSAMETASRATSGVTAAQERARQAQVDAVEVQHTATDSTQTMAASQQSWVDSTLGLTSATDGASSSLKAHSLAMGDGAAAATDGLTKAGDSATAFGAAATEGADTFLGGLSKMLSGAGDWISGLFSGTGQQQKVIKNADGSTSFAPSVKGAGGSWLDRPIFEDTSPQALFDAGQGGSWKNGQWVNPSQSGGLTWGQSLQGVGGIASGAMTATQKGATAGQKIGGGLMMAGGVVAMIPGGQIVGGVMMAAGALLSAVTGAKDRGEKYSISHITLQGNSKYALGASAQDNDGDATRFNSDASKVAKGLNDIAARLDLKPGTADSYIDSKNKSAEQAALDILKGMKSGVPEIAYAIAHESAVSLEDMLNHLEFANGFNTQVQALRSTISDLFSEFQTGVEAGNTLGRTLTQFVDNAQTVFAVSKGAKLPGFARGTVSAPSGWAIVGEEGPEVVQLAGGERIWNARESAQMLAAQGIGADTELVHVRPDELAWMRQTLGGMQTNPSTGLPMFLEGETGGVSDTGGSRGGAGSGGDSNDDDSGGWGLGGLVDAISGFADDISGWTSDIAGWVSDLAGWQSDNAENTATQTEAMAGLIGLGPTAVAAALSAAASTIGPGLTGMLEAITGERGTAAAVSHDYGDQTSAVSGTAGTIGERAVAANGGRGSFGAWQGASAAEIDSTLAALTAAIKADPTGKLTSEMVGSARVGDPGSGGISVKELADNPAAILWSQVGDPAIALQQLDTAAQQLLKTTGAIPEVLQRALDGANARAAALGIPTATAARQVQETAERQKAEKLDEQFTAVGLVRSRVSELNDIVVSLGNNTFSPIGKDFDKLASDMAKAADAYIAAGQTVPDGLYGAMKQMQALGAVKQRLLDEVSGVTVETSPEQKKVEQLKGKWSNTATDLVKAFNSVGIVGDELAAKLNEGFSNALRQEQGSYSDTLDTAFRKSKGEEGYDSAVTLIDSYKTAVDDVNSLWPEGAARADQMAKVTGTLTNNMAGLVKSGSITSTSLQQIITAFSNTPEVVNAARAALQALNDATAEATRTFNSGVSARMQAAVGNARGSGLITLDEQQRQELRTAQEAGRDTTQLQQVQLAERGLKAFELAQADVVAAYDQQITSQQDLITNLQEGAVAAAAVARQFRQAYDSLALGDTSPLGAYDKLLEARRQFEAAYSTATSSTASDTEKTAAQSLLQQLGPSLVSLAQAYFANSNREDYDRVRTVFDQLGTAPTGSAGDTADQQLQAAQASLKELQRQRADAARIGERQYGAISDLKGVMDQSYAVWQAALSPLQRLTGTTPGTSQPTTVNTSRYAASAAVQAQWDGLSASDQLGVARQIGWQGDIDESFNIWLATASGKEGSFESEVSTADKRRRLLAFTAADIEANFGQFPDIQAARAANPGFDLAEWFIRAGINEVLAGTRHIPGFATGTMATPPGAVWVGEKGPELLWQGGGAAVASSADSVRIASLWQSAANDRMPASYAAFTPSRQAAPAQQIDLTPFLDRIDALTREVQMLRAERSRDARGHAALTEQDIAINAAGHARTEAALKREQNVRRAA